ncbi:MAG: WG repeat-containing protein [Bacteroidota bacterium]
MKIKVALFSALFFVSGLYSFSQNQIIHAKPVGAASWKYIDLKGQILFESEYPLSYEFSEDGVAVEYFPKKNLYIIINTKGQVIQTQLEKYEIKDAFGYAARKFSCGLIPIKTDKHWGYMNTEGKVAIEMKYDNVQDFEDGYATARISKTFFVLDITGKETSVDDKTISDVKHFSEHLAPFTSLNRNNGFIDINGKIVIPANFKDVGFFKNGLAWARSTEGLIGYINTKGEWVIKPQFTMAKDFDKTSGLARVKNGEKWSYISTTGEVINFDIADSYDDFYEGLAVGKKGGLCGFYNNKGTWVIQPQFTAVRDFKNGFAAAKQGTLWGIINKEGKWVINPTYAGIKDVIITK